VATICCRLLLVAGSDAMNNEHGYGVGGVLEPLAA